MWKIRVEPLLSGLTPHAQYTQIMQAMSDTALRRAIAGGFSASKPISYNWRVLDECFAKTSSPSVYMHTFLSRCQEPGETAFDYLHQLREMASRAFPNLPNPNQDDVICSRFAQGVSSYELKCQLLRQPAKSVSEAIEVVKRFESVEHILTPAASTPCYALGTTERRTTVPASRQRRPNAPSSSQPPIPSQQHDDPSKCYYCRRFGRRAWKCGHNKKPQGEPCSDVPLFDNCSKSPLLLEGKLQGTDVTFLVDTGASSSVVRTQLVQTLGVKPQPLPNQLQLITANGAPIEVTDMATLSVTFPGFTCVQSFVICDGIRWDAILGVDFLTEKNAVIDLRRFQIRLGTHNLACRRPVNRNQSANVCALPQMTVVNIHDNPHLSLKDRTDTLALLQEYSCVFDDGQVMGRTNIVQHEIQTGDNLPIRTPPRRVPIHYQQQLDTMITDMLRKKVIKPSTSPWASPIVLVKKKDGSLRLCVDYRRLNAITQRDSFPLPRIDATLDALGGAQWFSTLDLASGYWQVEIRPEDRPKTAFVVPTGLYEFETMPFGLSNAPATFQRLMQTVLAGLVPKKCLIYLDDIIVFGQSLEDHHANLRAVFQRLRESNLKLQASKCKFLQKSVNFLGHEITPQGVHTDSSKTQAVLNWPTPKSTTDVRSFMGLASYYRRFVQNFASIAAPLHRLTEKGRKFVWTNECQVAFDTLKKRLTSPPVLSFPDTSAGSGPFILDTDASAHAIGAVLSQTTSDGQIRVIAYASRMLDKRETRYSTTRREMLALVYFLSYFRHYLLGRKFRVRTDHKALQWLQNFRDADGQLARWQERLQEFDFICEYRPGKRHGNADSLSRLPDCENTLNVLLGAAADTDWASLQAADTTIQPIYLRQQHGNDKPTSKELRDLPAATRCICEKWGLLRLIDNVLYIVEPNANPRLLVPTVKVPELISQVHHQLGHAGQQKTEHAIRQRFWWPLIHHDVMEFCRNCAICAQIKQPKPTPRAPLVPMLTEAPNHRVGVDIIGPVPTSRRGNRYILVMVDYFTKWCEAVPLQQQDALTIGRAFIDNWVSRFGAPLYLHSDQGAAFESLLISHICNAFGIRKTHTTPYHPQGNGLVERTNRTIKHLLRAFLHNAPENTWDDVLPQCLLAYRSSVHSSTGFSPALLLFGHELRLPVEIRTPLLPYEKIDCIPYVRNLRHHLDTAYNLTRRHLQSSSQHQKSNYDRFAHGPTYSPGDYVWLHRPSVPAGSCPKFYAPWKGPYEIVQHRPPTTYVLRNLRRPQENLISAHYNQLKPHCPPAVKEPSTSSQPPPATTYFEVPTDGGSAYPIPPPGTEDSASRGEGAM
uniref:RNA-directed DNA polymerase n=1 Tax=Trichobilharzia regenti TaxID=157069 RepID=A0AA85JYK8_TRIRE|nr:unnamed protein product [Trichobilharzia regenti]